MGRFVKTYAEIKKLPPGHVDRRSYSNKIRAIYSDCADIERTWAKHFGKKLPRFDANQALTFCNQMCDALGQRPLRAVIVSSPDVKEEWAAHYDPRAKEIHIRYGSIYFTILIHELTHHFDRSFGHGKDFCDMEQFLFGVAYTMVTGKQPHRMPANEVALDWYSLTGVICVLHFENYFRSVAHLNVDSIH